MKEKMRLNRLYVLLACLALAVLLVPTTERTMAYFTHYITAKGSVDLGSFKVTTEIIEQVDNNRKTVTIRNTGDVPCYIRVSALAGRQFALEFTPENAGSWVANEDDGWWYYREPVDPEASTDSLMIEITWEKDEIQGDFNVIVVEECTPVRYEPDGTPYADWNAEAKEVGKQ